MDRQRPVREHYLFREWYPGLFIIVPEYQHEDLLSTLSHLVIVSYQGRPPPLITTSIQQRIWRRPVRRAVSGTVRQLLPILYRVEHGDTSVVDALLCYTRGEVVPAACDDCLEQDGPFYMCVTMEGAFRERCANCILNLCTNCTYALRRTPETDDEYISNTDFEGASSRLERQRDQRQMQLRSRQNRRQREEDSVLNDEHTRCRPRSRGSGTAGNPIDLTGDDL